MRVYRLNQVDLPPSLSHLLTPSLGLHDSQPGLDSPGRRGKPDTLAPGTGRIRGTSAAATISDNTTEFAVGRGGRSVAHARVRSHRGEFLERNDGGVTTSLQRRDVEFVDKAFKDGKCGLSNMVANRVAFVYL